MNYKFGDCVVPRTTSSIRPIHAVIGHIADGTPVLSKLATTDRPVVMNVPDDWERAENIGFRQERIVMLRSQYRVNWRNPFGALVADEEADRIIGRKMDNVMLDVAVAFGDMGFDVELRNRGDRAPELARETMDRRIAKELSKRRTLSPAPIPFPVFGQDPAPATITIEPEPIPDPFFTEAAELVTFLEGFGDEKHIAAAELIKKYVLKLYRKEVE